MDWRNEVTIVGVWFWIFAYHDVVRRRLVFTTLRTKSKVFIIPTHTMNSTWIMLTIPIAGVLCDYPTE